MTKLWSLHVIVLLLMLLPSDAQTPDNIVFNQPTDPASLIGSYYNAVHLRDYGRAYSYWETPPQGRSLQQFANGFSDTASASVLVELPIVSGAAAGNLFASLPVVISAQHTDGTLHTYTGCFIVHKTNVPVGNALQPDPNWYIRSGILQEQFNTDITLLTPYCLNQQRLVESLIPVEHPDPITTVQTYFTALATGASGIAANLWRATDTFAPQYSQAMYFAKDNQLFINPLIALDGTAGSTYATVPALLVIIAPDDNYQLVTACFVTRTVTAPQGELGLIDTNYYMDGVTFLPAANAIVAIPQLQQSCSTVG